MGGPENTCLPGDGFTLLGVMSLPGVTCCHSPVGVSLAAICLRALTPYAALMVVRPQVGTANFELLACRQLDPVTGAKAARREVVCVVSHTTPLAGAVPCWCFRGARGQGGGGLAVPGS